MKRIHKLKDVCGHSWLINYLENKLKLGTLPHFIIFDGCEGIGKTTIADILAIRLAYGENPDPEIEKMVIDDHKSTDLIKKFVMSVDGGKETAKEVLAEMTSSFVKSNKVIICDECHGMSVAAQDVFLDQSEFLKGNVYLLMMTTDPQLLKPTLRSRATSIHLQPLKTSEMLQLLNREVAENNLNVQGGEQTLRMIANWSENKPRTALSVLNAFSNGESVSEGMIRELVGYMDIDEVLPICQGLSGSMVDGLATISDMNVSNSLIAIVMEFLRIKIGKHSYRLKMSDHVKIMDALNSVTEEQLTMFLYGLTSQPILTKTTVINSFIKAHKNFNSMFHNSSKEVLSMEVAQRNEVSRLNEVTSNEVIQAPTIDMLLNAGSIIQEQ